MGSINQLRQRIERFKHRVDKMLQPANRNSAPPGEIGLAITDSYTISEHRAAAQALLEGVAKPPSPDKDVPTQEQLRNALRTTGPRRNSVPTSRSSFFAQHFAMSVSTTGYGHALGWNIPESQNSSEQDDQLACYRVNLFPDPENETAYADVFTARAARRRSRLHHSVANPSLGGYGRTSLHEQDEEYWERVMDLIRALAETGHLDVSHLIEAGVPVSDPQLKVALYSALESSPGQAARIIEAIDSHDDFMSEDDKPQFMSPLRRARQSLQFTAKKARQSLFLPARKTWRDSQYRRSVWSRVSSRMSFVGGRYDK